MNNISKATTMRILSLTKARLDAARGSKSISSYIDSMLNYFEVTGTEPSSIKAHPGIEVVNRVESIMKVIKSIEKSKINPLLEKFDLILKSNPNLISVTRESQVTDEEVNQLVLKVNRLTETVSEKERIIARLESNLASARNENSGSSTLRRMNEIKGLIGVLFTDKYSKYDNHNNSFIISGTTKDLLIRQIEELINE